VHPPGHEVNPLARVRVNFGTVFAWWLRFRGIFRRSLRATTKKRSSTFLAKKLHPRQNPGYVLVVLLTRSASCVDVSITAQILNWKQVTECTVQTNCRLYTTISSSCHVTLCYFTEFGKFALQKTICGGIYLRYYCIF